jgi:para-nitrobenzyl esterase
VTPGSSAGRRVRVALADGIAEGLAENGVSRFFSLPYAAPMTDENRFRAPQPVEPWPGVRDATRPGPCAPQNPSLPSELDTLALMGAPDLSGPDYLTLNVFAPEPQTGAGP